VKKEPSGEAVAAGWIFYDAECPICTRSILRWGGAWARRGFHWVPLQTPGAAARLRVPEAALLEEMKVLLPGGRVLGGADALAFLFRAVWWLWSVGALLSAPGLRLLGRALYRWLARRRYCLGGVCAIRLHAKRRHRPIAFLEMP
jgi:predicted DCC family thiol-disulfide oxidoreductase YuxK